MYKNNGIDHTTGLPMPSVNKITDDETIISIPFAPDNTDYQTFKKEVLAGAELQDADGNVMTQEQATEFINTLPQ
jgi:hypothetical protein